MHRSIARWQTGGFIFVSILGTFLHFLFDLTGQNILAALFSAVNESIWEHLKLLYVPMVLFALWEYCRWGRQETGFWHIKLTGLVLGLSLVPVLYYTYTGISGINADLLNIIIFFAVAAAVYYLETKLFIRKPRWQLPAWAAVVLIAAIGILFVFLTFLPPHIPFFRDPTTGTYGFTDF